MRHAKPTVPKEPHPNNFCHGPKGPVANTDTKLLIYRLFQKARVLAQDGHGFWLTKPSSPWVSYAFFQT